jgi:SAM-dependent methyltransferase
MLLKPREFWDFQWEKNPDGMINTSACNLFRAEDIKGKKVLDVGCGNVRYSLLEPLAGDFTGADISMTVLLRQIKNANAKPKLVVCDAMNLPFGANQFDSVFSIDTLTLLGQDYYRALEEMRRVTNGVIVFDVTHADQPKSGFVQELELGRVRYTNNGSCMILEEPNVPDRVYFDEKTICAALEKLDLVPESIRTFTANEENNLGVPIYEQQYEPEMEYKQKIFVRALKRQ